MAEEKIRILLVESSFHDAQALQKIMRDRAIADEVDWVKDIPCACMFLRQEAEYIHARRPDIILFSLKTPDTPLGEIPLAATDVAKDPQSVFLTAPQKGGSFRSIYRAAPDIPIVILSDLDDQHLAIQAVQEGAQDYLVKKRIDSDLLNRTINYAIERKKIQEKLYRSETYFRSLIENSSDITLTLDEKGVITYINPSIEKILGYASEEVVNRNCYEFIHPDDGGKVRIALNRIANRACFSDYIELRVRHKNGSWRIFDGTAKNLPEDFPINGVVINSHDITERKKVEEELKKHIEDLERFTKITVGRELKMSELKKEIAELKKKTNSMK